MAERFNAAVLKTVELLPVPGVRIPLPPPTHVRCGHSTPSLSQSKLGAAYGRCSLSGASLDSSLKTAPTRIRLGSGKDITHCVFTVEQAANLTLECENALQSAIEKVSRGEPHALFVMSNCRIAVRYLAYIHSIATKGFSPIAVSLYRTYYEIVCSTMYLAEHKEELDDFLDFGRVMTYEIGEKQNISGKLLNQLVPDHKELLQRFRDKKKRRGGKQLSWHGMKIEILARTVGMEKYSDQKIVRAQYSIASKLVHGDSLLALLAFKPEVARMIPRPFLEPSAQYGVQAIGSTCALFIALLASVNSALSLNLTDEYDRLNKFWQQIWKDVTGVDPQETVDRLTKASEGN